MNRIIILLILLIFPLTKGSCQNRLLLEWLGNGLILVTQPETEQTWLFNPMAKTFEPLPYSTKHKNLIPSWSGERIIVHDGVEEFQYGPIRGPLSKPLSIPTWVTFSDETDKIVRGEHVFFWISANEFFVNQRNKETGEMKCKIFDVTKNTWGQFAKFCLPELNLSTNEVLLSPHHFIVIYGTDEGVLALHVNQWKLDKGFQEMGFPDFNLYQGVLETHFYFDMPRIDLTTPCILERAFLQKEKLPCDEISLTNSAWRLYAWSPNQSLKLLRDDLPPFAQPSPLNSNVIAWSQGSAICVGNPGRAKRSTCTSIPNK